MRAVQKSVLLVLLTTPIFVSSSSVFANSLRCEWAYFDSTKKPTEPSNPGDKIVFPKYHAVMVTRPDKGVCAEHAGRGLLDVKASQVCYWKESTQDPEDVESFGGGCMTYFQAYVKYAKVKSRLPKPKQK